MDIVYAVQQYVSKMTEGVSGMKALLLDKETTSVVSMVCSRSQVLEMEVFLFQRLDAQRRGQVMAQDLLGLLASSSWCFARMLSRYACIVKEGPGRPELCN